MCFCLVFVVFVLFLFDGLCLVCVYLVCVTVECVVYGVRVVYV